MKSIVVAVVIYAAVCGLAALFLSKLFGLNPREDESGNGKPDSLGREVQGVGVHGQSYGRGEGARS